MSNTAQLNFNVLNEFVKLGDSIKESKMQGKKYTSALENYTNLCQYLTVSNIDVVMFTAFLMIGYGYSFRPSLHRHSSGEGRIDIKQLADFFDVSPLQILQHKESFAVLTAQKLLKKHNASDSDRQMAYFGIQYSINANITHNIMDNVPIEPQKESETQKDYYSFFADIVELIEENTLDTAHTVRTPQSSVYVDLETEYNKVPFIKKLQKIFPKIQDRVLLYAVCDDYINEGAKTRLNGVLKTLYISAKLRVRVAREIKNKEHPLIKKDFITVGPDHFFGDSTLGITSHALEFMLKEEAALFNKKKESQNVIKHETLVQKSLYFDSELQKQIDFMQNSLSQERHNELVERLQQKSLSKGVAALFYGHPGTGKTESAYQIAKATGRNIYHVDISETKSMWFGESEKKIKKIFTDYKSFCKTEKSKPILLFNEADAVFSKRKNSNSSKVAQTENAIQNIILEALEKFEGILIATTNLENNLDAAFERRFLFKVKFEKPTHETQTKIWQSKFPFLTTEQAGILSTHYAFSGGEIDNILRKLTIDELLSGTQPHYSIVETFCKQEKLGEQSCKIGFC